MSFIRSFSQMPNMSKCTLYLRAWRMCWSDESGNSNEMSGLWFRVERMRQWVGLGRLQAGCRNKCRNNSYLARIDEDFWLCDEFPWFPSHLCPVSSEWWLALMRLGRDPILSHWRLSLPATHLYRLVNVDSSSNNIYCFRMLRIQATRQQSVTR